MDHPATNSPSGSSAHSGHTITLDHEGRHVTVAFAGVTVADTTKAITLKETGYPPMLYIPLEDVGEKHLSATAHTSHCPFKGEARYWTLQAGGQQAENAVWAYDAPYDDVAGITGHAAFYPEKVAISAD